jgi:hypothetical protein
VIGRNVDPGCPGAGEARHLRRLQNEVQMRLHEHPLNAAREAAGAAGQLGLAQRLRRRAAGAGWPPTAGRRPPARPALAEDWAAWTPPGGRWTPARWPSCAAQMKPRTRALTLCGERDAVTWPSRGGAAVAAPGGALATAGAGRSCWSRCDAAADARRAAARELRARAGRRAPAAGALAGARGVRGADELDDGLARLLPPGHAARRGRGRRLLADAIARGRRICIVADYDCDGATACAVALRGLAMLGAAPGRCTTWCPTARVHGYGLTPAIVDLAHARSGRHCW